VDCTERKRLKILYPSSVEDGGRISLRNGRAVCVCSRIKWGKLQIYSQNETFERKILTILDTKIISPPCILMIKNLYRKKNRWKRWKRWCISCITNAYFCSAWICNHEIPWSERGQVKFLLNFGTNDTVRFFLLYQKWIQLQSSN
jgi:hypothetical protein